MAVGVSHVDDSRGPSCYRIEKVAHVIISEDPDGWFSVAENGQVYGSGDGRRMKGKTICCRN
jgi:hypothetical protein